MLSQDLRAVSLEDLAAASEAARLRGDYADGVQLALQAADLAVQLQRPRSHADMLRLLANQQVRLGSIEQAAAAAGAAAAIDAEIGNEAGRSRALTLQAFAYIELGLSEEALQALAISLEIAQRLRDPDLLFWAYNRIGNAQGHLGKQLEARNFLRQALPFSAGLGAEAKFCILNNLADNAVQLAWQAHENGDAALLADALDYGLRYANDAIELARAASHPYREAICLGNLGMLLAFSGDQAGATRSITRSHAIASQKGYLSLVHDAGFGLGRIAMLMGDLTGAIARFEDVLPSMVANDEKPITVEVHRLLSDLYQQTGAPERALAHFKSYHALESGMRSSVAETRNRMVTSMTELSAAKLEAERARLETSLHQMQLAEMEVERRELLLRTSELDRKAHEDELTGLKNRRYALGALAERLANCPDGQQVFVAIVDADHFKAVNDQLGHAAGDDVLRALGQVLVAGIGADDLVARLGGEEFLLAFTGSVDRVEQLCAQLIAAAAANSWPDGIAVTISIGLTRGAPHETVGAVLGRADGALYRSKSGGRNRLTTDLIARHHSDNP